MKKVLTQKLLAMLCTGVIGISLFYACKKKELPPPEQKTVIKEKFFEIPAGTDSTVAAIAGSVKRQNDKRNFLQRLIENAGLPVWNKAKVMMKSPQEGKQVFIPFILESKQTTRAILIVKLKGTDTLYHLLYNTQARQYGFDSTSGTWNAKDIFHAFMLFDNELFGTTKYTVTEKSFVNATDDGEHTAEILKTGNTSTAKENNIYPVVTWVTFVVCGQCGFKNAETSTSRCCNAQYYLVPVTYWFNEGDDSFGYYTPEGGFHAGGGGGDASMCTGCNWEDTNPCPLDQYGHATGFCDEDWEPVPVLTQVYNPLTYDSITVDHRILDSNLTCLYNLLTSDMAKINQKSQLMLSSIFDVSLYNHLHFRINYTATDSPWIMRTTPGRLTWTGDNRSFYDTVEINPYFVQHATKEMLIAATIHESIHAYINWCFLSYRNNQANGIDSNYLIAHFPIHWEYFKNRHYSTQHELMVNNYIDEITNAVIEGGNPSSPLLTRTLVGKALAYSGLRETSVWQSLSTSDTCLYNGIKAWGQDFDKPGNFQFNVPGCRSYGNSFKDSLHLSGLCH